MEYRQLILLYSGDFEDLISKLPEKFPERDDVIIAVSDAVAEDLTERITESATEAIKRHGFGLGISIQRHVLCLTNTLSNLRELMLTYQKIKKNLGCLSFDIVFAGDMVTLEESRGLLEVSRDFANEQVAFIYLNRSIYTGVSILNEDISVLCYAIISSRLNRIASRLKGLIFVRVSFRSIEPFNLPEQLAYRKLRDNQELNWSVDEDRIRAFIDERVNLYEVSRAEFHCLIWHGYDFQNRKYRSIADQMKQEKFISLLDQFIQMNCTKEFDDLFERARGGTEDLIQPLLKHAFPDSIDSFLGQDAISALEMIRGSLSKLQQDFVQNAASAHNFAHGPVRAQDLWEYANHVYDYGFSFKLDQVRQKCFEELTNHLYSKIDKLILVQKENLKRFADSLKPIVKKTAGNTFAIEVYDLIDGLYKSDSLLESRLRKRISDYINNRHKNDGSPEALLLDSETFAQFYNNLADAGRHLFTEDALKHFEGFISRVANPEDNSFVLLHKMSFDTIQSWLGERAARSVIVPESEEICKLLKNNFPQPCKSDLFAVYDFFPPHDPFREDLIELLVTH